MLPSSEFLKENKILNITNNYLKKSSQPLNKFNNNFIEYFKKQKLPTRNQLIYREKIKVKLVQHEAMDILNSNSYEYENTQLNTLSTISIQNLSISDMKNKLLTLLEANELEDIEIHITESNSIKDNVNLNICYDRRNDIKKYIYNFNII